MHATSDKGCTLGPIACQNSKLYAAYGRVDKMDPIGAKKKAITWQTTLWTTEDEAYHGGGGVDAREEWADVLRRAHMRPDESHMLASNVLGSVVP